VHYQGAVSRLNTVTEDGTRINATSADTYGGGDDVRLTWPKSAVHLMKSET
jgi:hypothetical protein